MQSVWEYPGKKNFFLSVEKYKEHRWFVEKPLKGWSSKIINFIKKIQDINLEKQLANSEKMEDVMFLK